MATEFVLLQCSLIIRISQVFVPLKKKEKKFLLIYDTLQHYAVTQDIGETGHVSPLFEKFGIFNKKV